MSEEKDESFISSLGLIRKFHPVAFALMFGFMFLTSQIWNSSLPLTEKIAPLALSFSLYLIAAFFEFYRVSKEQEIREKSMF
ncbi:MAG: hypothetical protein IBV52_09570 [Candidatus Bathyarchaeota archaeon]